MDLERELRDLAAHVAWPAPPASLPALAAPARARRRLLVLALAVAVAAVATAFAVPGSRGAILRFLHLRGVTVELVDRLPPAQERPLGAGLGPAVTLRRALQAVPELILPPGASGAPLHVRGPVVSLLLSYRGEPVLLSEFRSAGVGLLKKSALGATHIESVRVRGDGGLWLTGLEHVAVFPGAPPRLAGHVLVWAGTSATYRIEGRTLARADALALARTLRAAGAVTPSGW